MKIWKLALVAGAALAFYLLLWPTGVEPVAWDAPLPPGPDTYPANDVLRHIQRIGAGVGLGPETVNVDAAGRVYTGYSDGRIVQLAPDGRTYMDLANTHGRPLGITFGPDGGLVIADAGRGLLALGRKISVLADRADDVPFGLTNDVDNTVMDKNVYFTDSTSKFAGTRYLDDLLEHGAHGRLMQYNVATGDTHVLLKDLHYANGVAVGPDDAYVLVSETSEYRVLRYWLKGDKAGTHDVFIDNLPGFPDNISYNNRDRFWLALAAPRNPQFDQLLSGHLFERRLLSRLPSALRPQPQRRAFVLGLDLNGKVIANLQYAGADAYAPVTSVREFGPWLYFGSLAERTIGRMPLHYAVASAPLPPSGWEKVPDSMQVPLPHSAESDREEEEEEEAEQASKRAQKRPPH
ncbi:MAG TPA: SMP-30/gluconolactonase/LRE family protein [Nevskiaceae bacterium]|nr:SMP-30/gluconolactonase/LRE family protein [Nevskiaceae bacterium]